MSLEVTRPIRLLVVADEQGFARLRSLLSPPEGRFSIAWARTFDDGLAQIARKEHDACLIDSALSGHRGIELIRLAKAQGCQTPLIVMAHGDEPSTDQASLVAGATACLDMAQLDWEGVERAVRYAIEHTRTVKSLRVFRSAIEQCQDAVILVALEEGQEPVITYVNRSYTRLMGFSPEELIGKPLQLLESAVSVRGGQFDEFRDSNPQIREMSGESCLRRRDGMEVSISWSISPILDESGRATHGVLTVRDIGDHGTASSRLVQTDRLASIGVMASGISHEINNPLAYVLANLSYVQEELKSMDATASSTRLVQIRAALDEVREGAERVRNIVRDLNTFSQSARDRVESVDPRRLVEKALVMTMNETKQRGRVVTELGTTPAVKAHEGKLVQVFVGLILNAAQSLRREARENVIKVVSGTDERGQAVIEIHDTGSGISPENLPRLFKPFFTTKPPGEGSGLSLAISRDLISSLGGELTVETELGCGSTFRVALPAVQAPALASGSANTKPVTQGRRRILVIDDEPFIAGALMRNLGGDYEVEGVTGGLAALDRLRRGEVYDVLLCDLMMPDMDGMEFFHELKAMHPKLCDRVVFLTGGAYTESAAQFLEETTNPRLMKPFDLTELRAVLSAVLSASRVPAG